MTELQCQIVALCNVLVIVFVLFFYRVMQLSAKRGITIVSCRLSVCPSVYRVRLSIRLTLVDRDHIGWTSWKLNIVRVISPTTVALRSPKAIIHLLPGEHGELWGRLEVGEVVCWSTKGTCNYL